MNRRIELHDLAAQDIRQAVRRYNQISPGLGDGMWVKLRQVLFRLRTFPNLYEEIEPDIRRVKLAPAGWPYQMVYLVEPDRVVIIAMLHDKRPSQTLDERLAAVRP